jgi:triosephosphate isomerase
MSAPRPRWVIGNWKMNGNGAANAALVRALVAGLSTGGVAHDRRPRVAVCPPVIYAAQVAELIADSPVRLGAQDVCAHAEGAYTGQISTAMLSEFGVSVVLVGHSERRSMNGERDEDVAAKACAALGAGFDTVVCVGETLAERDRGDAENVVGRQIDAVIPALAAHPGRALIAYEPVWAIGTGRTATVEVAQGMHRFIRERLAAGSASLDATPILYGGSVKAGNAVALAQAPDIDGVLVGGASLDANEFLGIINAFTLQV